MAVFSVGEIDNTFGDGSLFRSMAREMGVTHFRVTMPTPDGPVNASIEVGRRLTAWNGLGVGSQTRDIAFAGRLRWYVGAGWHVECDIEGGVITHVATTKW